MTVKTPNQKSDTQEIDNFLEQIQNAYISAADITLIKGKHPNKNKPIKRKNQKWYNLSCQQLQKNLNRLGRILTKNPNNHFVKEQYFQQRRKYKANCRKEKRKYEEIYFKTLKTCIFQTMTTFGVF